MAYTGFRNGTLKAENAYITTDVNCKNANVDNDLNSKKVNATEIVNSPKFTAANTDFTDGKLENTSGDLILAAPQLDLLKINNRSIITNTNNFTDQSEVGLTIKNQSTNDVTSGYGTGLEFHHDVWNGTSNVPLQSSRIISYAKEDSGNESEMKFQVNDGSGLKDAIRINKNGIRNLVDTYVFAFRDNPVENITGNGDTADVVYNSILHNINGGYNGSTGIFSAPASGTYCIHTAVFIDEIGESHNYVILELSGLGRVMRLDAVNPSKIKSVHDSLILQGNTVVYLNKGNNIKISIVASGSDKTIGLVGTTTGYNTHLSIKYLG